MRLCLSSRPCHQPLTIAPPRGWPLHLANLGGSSLETQQVQPRNNLQLA